MTDLADFFQPDTTYLLDAAYRAPEVLPEFHCVAVREHPSKRELRAFGFRRPGRFSPWISTALTLVDWDWGWIEAPQNTDSTTASV